ncbi:MAG TPA: ROK family protein [Calidithermus sp.]|nr:ROK family protein [Calidithermus sp.]
MHGVIIGVDVGATTISAGLITPHGEVLTAVQVPTRSTPRADAVQTLFALVRDLAAEGRQRRLDLHAIGIGLPGLVDVERGMMVDGFNLVSEFAHVPLAERLEAAAGLPAFVDNDANALALGEWMYGSARGASSFALLAVGTGVGGGMVLDGRLIRGEQGLAGEWGHVSCDPRGPACVCGARGCLNTYAGGQALAEAARREARRGRGGRLAALAGHPEAITAEVVFQAAALGDSAAAEIVERACRALGATVGMIVNSLNPALVLVTGGVAGSLAPLRERIFAHAARCALAPALAAARLIISPTDKSRTVVGGAALAVYELERRAARGPADRQTAAAEAAGTRARHVRRASDPEP